MRKGDAASRCNRARNIDMDLAALSEDDPWSSATSGTGATLGTWKPISTTRATCTSTATTSGLGTAPVSDDGEYEWFETIAAAHLPRLVTLLGGADGENVLDLLARKYTGVAR